MVAAKESSLSTNNKPSSSDIMARLKLKDAYITDVLAPFYKQDRVIFNKFDLASDDAVFFDPSKARHRKNSLKNRMQLTSKAKKGVKRSAEEKTSDTNNNSHSAASIKIKKGKTSKGK